LNFIRAINQFIKAQFIDNNPIPKEASFEELWDWYDRLQTVENKVEENNS